MRLAHLDVLRAQARRHRQRRVRVDRQMAVLDLHFETLLRHAGQVGPQRHAVLVFVYVDGRRDRERARRIARVAASGYGGWTFCGWIAGVHDRLLDSRLTGLTAR
ncbi:hypothetical protein DO72_5243 [Burkholderia pseudomallei]|nr:hypothetical protein DO72_5243 [Burkholderia pseudomallei]